MVVAVEACYAVRTIHTPEYSIRPFLTLVSSTSHNIPMESAIRLFSDPKVASAFVRSFVHSTALSSHLFSHQLCQLLTRGA
jgi:hypothetical protein